MLNGQLGLSFKGLPQAIAVKIGKAIVEFQPGTFQPVACSSAFQERIEAAIALFKTWRLLHDMELSHTEADEIELQRHVLNEEYDAFVSQYGTVDQNSHLFRFDSMPDPRLRLLKALEKDGQKADIFRDRLQYPEVQLSGQIYDTINKENLQAAISRVKDVHGIADDGSINVAAIAEWFGTDIAAIVPELVGYGLVLEEPVFAEEGDRSS